MEKETLEKLKKAKTACRAKTPPYYPDGKKNPEGYVEGYKGAQQKILDKLDEVTNEDELQEVKQHYSNLGQQPIPKDLSTHKDGHYRGYLAASRNISNLI